MTTSPVLERPVTVDPEASPRRLTHWRERVSAAQLIGGFTIEDRHEISKFRSCAVGESYGFPEELSINDVPMPLRGYGMEMVNAVHKDDFDRAFRLIGAIEEAAAF